MKPKRAIIICGATSTGKTNISAQLAYSLSTEIISADSMQIYKNMNIGTAKETLKIKQHMIDICEPDCNFTVYDYSTQALALIDKINSTNKLPIICGGTGLYINSLLYKMNFGGNMQDKPDIMELIESNLAKYGKNYIYDELNKYDPESARNIHPNNIRRVCRTLYLCLLNDKPLSQVKIKKERSGFDIYVICRNRIELRNRIEERVNNMFNLGLKDEIDSLIKKGYLFSLQSMQGIGYKEWEKYFSNIETEEDVKKQIILNTNKYMKRQETWFRNQYRDIAGYVNINSLEDETIFVELLSNRYEGII